MIPRSILALFILSCVVSCGDCCKDGSQPETVQSSALSPKPEAQPDVDMKEGTQPEKERPNPGTQEEETDPKKDADLAAKTLAAEIEAKVSKLRGLQIKTPTAVGAYTEDELRAYLAEKVGASLDAEVVTFYTRAFVLLNLYQPDVDIAATTMALLSEQVAGFYEPERKELFVVKREGDAMAKMDRIVMAHELVHALQDQHYDLKTMLEEISDDDDAVSARKSLVEGDATWAMLAFEQGIAMARLALPRMPDSLGAFMALVEQAKKMGMGGMIDTGTFSLDALTTTPAVDADEMIFSYYGGAKFCLHLLQKEGDKKAVDMERLDAAFKNPPASTEQVMHPAKYDVDRDDPVKVTLPDLNSVLGEGWKELGQNTLGELRMRTLFTETEGISAKVAKAAHEGWDGDRYALYAKDGCPDILVWASVWDSADDSREFVSALMRNQGAPEDVIAIQKEPSIRSLSWNLKATTGACALVITKNNQVFFVRGAPGTLSNQLLRYLESETKWTETGSTAKDR